MIKLVNIIYIIFFLILLSGCSRIFPPSEKFTLDMANPEPINGRKLSNEKDSIVKINDNEIYIYNGGIASMRQIGQTQMHADYTVNIDKGDGIRFAFRTVEREYNPDKGIIFDYLPDASYIRENGKLIRKVDSVRAQTNNPKRIQISNDGLLYLVTVDCDTVYYGKTNLLATEFLILEPLRSDVRISGISIDNVVEEDDQSLKKRRVLLRRLETKQDKKKR